MGRQIRRVPLDWLHPKDEDGEYIPLLDESFSEALAKFEAEERLWEAGTHEFQTKYGYKKEEFENFGEVDAPKPTPDRYRPDWKPGEATGFQLYQTVDEGAPISPVFATAEELIQHVTTKGDDWDQVWKRKDVEKMLEGKELPTMIRTELPEIPSVPTKIPTQDQSGDLRESKQR
jgi:hypothetical protein